MKGMCNECLNNSFSYSNTKYEKLRDHVLNQNSDEDEDMKTFFRNHVALWNTEEFISELRK